MSSISIPGYENPKPRELPLEVLCDFTSSCQRCVLGQTRTNLVFGTGNPHARVMLIGEGPGRFEDLQGEPFVGASGKRLDELLLRCGMKREEVYIANVVKCRPPDNRDPKPEEIEACAPYLREQIRSIWPDVLICLGNFASQFVLKTELGVTKLRGRLHQVGHFQVMPTFHPAATIRHAAWLPLLEEDLRMVSEWLAEHPQEEREL